MELIPLMLYSFFLTFILFYSFVEFNLVIKYIFRTQIKPNIQKIHTFPFVTIQLPIYNEAYVVEELLDHVANIQYPKDKYEIQLLDDSTDETSMIAAEKIKGLTRQGITVHHIRRTDRTGFKAGALAHGLQTAHGQFIAIFDADFHPHPEFLSKTLPYFMDVNIGMVQTKWGHHNKNYSLLTRLQAFALDAHFTVQQVGRHLGNHFINFNGTAGIWRKRCIETSGGWQSDTLTEDLDLSYRAQLNHWQCLYVPDLVNPAELPVEIHSFKTQQFRWSKGAAECSKKHLFSVWRHQKLPLSTKIHATFHLCNSFVHVCILASALLSLPVIYIMQYYPEYHLLYRCFSVYYLSLICVSVTYFTSEISKSRYKLRTFLEFLGFFPLFLSISMGLSLLNSVGVLEGYMGKKTSFVRTAKFNIKSKHATWVSRKYTSPTWPPLVLGEGLLFSFFVFAFIKIVHLHHYGAYPFFLMLCLGFGFVFCSSIAHMLQCSVSLRGRTTHA